MMSFIVNLIDDRSLDELIPTARSQQEQVDISNKPFNVCKATGSSDFTFTNGEIGVNGSPMLIQGYPPQVEVYLERNTLSFYKYAVWVELRKTNSFMIPAPAATYYFTDRTGDTYSLLALLPYLHHVSFNSADPTIVKVVMELKGVAPDYWSNAAICS